MTEPVRAALLIGCDEYSDPELPLLRGAGSDVEHLARLMLDPRIGRFDEVRTLPGTHRGVSREEITAAITTFFQRRKSDDFLLLYFAGHGLLTPQGDLVFCARDTFAADPAGTGIPAAWVRDRIAASRSGRVLVLLDCCFSGAFPAGWRPRAGARVTALEGVQGHGRIVITATTATEYAFENGRLVDGTAVHTAAFTAAVISGIATGSADRDGDGRVSVDDLYGYVYREVRAWGHQTPTKRGEVEGELFVSFRGPPPTPEMTGEFTLPRIAVPVPRPRESPTLEVIRPRVVSAPPLRSGQTATVRRWLSSVGQPVQHDTPLLELLYADGGGRARTIEVFAEYEGVLRGLSVVEGERVAGRNPLGLVALGASPNGRAAPTSRLHARTDVVHTVPVKLPTDEQGRPIMVLFWWASIGDRVDRGQPLLQVRVGPVETDVTSPVAGTLRAVALLDGEAATSEDVVAIISVL